MSKTEEKKRKEVICRSFEKQSREEEETEGEEE